MYFVTLFENGFDTGNARGVCTKARLLGFVPQKPNKKGPEGPF